MADQSRLDDLGSAVAEGTAVDWNRAEASARDATELAVVRQLRVLERMADAVRSLDAVASPPSVSFVDVQAGHMWGHLRIAEALDSGSFGTVYRAWDTRLECDVALKLIKASGVSEAFDLSRAMKEARLMARLRHQHVVKVFGAEAHGGRFGLWMELISGRTLEQQLAMQGPMGVSEAIPIGIDLCQALAAVHGAGLLHRDIKAHNVKREDGGRIVLMDFGTGGPIHGTESADSLAGTPLYLAPELFRGEKPSVQADIYSLGVLLYHLVTNDYPVRGATRRDVISAHQTGTQHALRDVRPDLSAGFIDVVQRALERDPSKRYKSAGEFGDALAAVAGRPHVHRVSEDSKRWDTWWRLAVAAAAVGLVVVGMSLALRNNEPRSDAMSTNQSSASAAPVENAASKPSAATSDSYDVQVTFYAFRNGQAVPLTQGSRVRLNDRLFARVNASRSVYLYIINRDDTGKSFLLFPLPGFLPRNPIPTNQMIRFPGTSDGLQHYWDVTSAGGREHFFLYVSPQQLVEFEQLMAALPRAEVGRTAANMPLSTSAIGTLRSIGGLSAAPGSPTPAAGTEFADLQPLSDQTETATGVWARRMTLQNPAE